MWILKGAALIRGRRLFEALRLLEEIRYIANCLIFDNMKTCSEKRKATILNMLLLYDLMYGI